MDYNLHIFCVIICKTCNLSALLTAYSQSKTTQDNPYSSLCPNQDLPPPPLTSLRLSLRPHPSLLKFNPKPNTPLPSYSLPPTPVCSRFLHFNPLSPTFCSTLPHILTIPP